MKPLEGIKVLDLSQRLPGPLAGKLLADKGAEVVKIEDTTAPDPFQHIFPESFDASFLDWYRELNAAKRLERLDLRAPDSRLKIATWIDWADIILVGVSDKFANQLGLGEQQLRDLAGPKVVLSLGASQASKTAMHDLNALAEGGFLDMHVAGHTHSPLAPPFLPIAGIAFGQQIALSALALLIKAQRERKCVVSKVFMLEAITEVFNSFWSEQLRGQKRTKFLHNGAYPCYCLYRSKDGDWVAVAAVEEKFWLLFAEALQLKLDATERFSRSPEVFQRVAAAIEKLTSAELDKLLVSKDICVSLIRHRA